MQTIHLADEMPEAEAEALGGTFPDDRSYDHLVRDACDVYRPDGSLLLAYRPGVLPAEACAPAYRAFRTAYFDGGNRGLASGTAASPALRPEEIGVRGRTRFRRLKRDGTLSRNDNAIAGRGMKTSAVVGYYDRTARFPYCRMTAFNLDHPERFVAALPFIRAVDAAFAAAVPGRHAAQMAIVRRTHPEFVIHGTAFTTITVNRNWQTAVHKDAGDLKAGFGVMTALRAGHFDGCFLCFPRQRVAVDMQTGGVLMADVHEYHGNTPFVGAPGQFERISCVFYYRERMADCGSPAEELEQAKRRRDRKGIKG